MSILTGIKASNVLAKAAGVTALALVAYDSHHFGKEKANEVEKEVKSDSLEDQMFNNMKLDSPSVVKASVKNKIFHLKTDEVLTGPFVRFKGYCEGFGEMCINHAIPLVLALGTMVGGIKSGGIKGGVSKLSALGLAAYAGTYLISEGFGGVKKHD